MATMNDLLTKLADVQNAVNSVSAKFATLTQQVADLTAAVANAPAQADIDKAAAQADSILAGLNGL